MGRPKKTNLDGIVNSGYDPYSDDTSRSQPPCQCFCNGGTVFTSQTLCIHSCNDCDPAGRSCAQLCDHSGCQCGGCGYYSGEDQCGWEHRMCGPQGYDPTNPLCYNNWHYTTVT